MKKISLFEIYKVFFKIGLILLGGGYVIVPIMQEELVKKRGWLTNDELVDFYCVAQCLAGIIAINTSILVCYKISRLKGVLIGVLGLITSPIISIIVIAKILDIIISIKFLEGIFWGVNLSIIILIYLTIKDMYKKSFRDIFCYFWFILILILAILKINLVILIVSSIFFGIILEFIKKRITKDINKNE